jgi:hypothetical protein
MILITTQAFTISTSFLMPQMQLTYIEVIKSYVIINIVSYWINFFHYETFLSLISEVIHRIMLHHRPTSEQEDQSVE